MPMNTGGAAPRDEGARSSVSKLNDQRGKNPSPFLQALRAKNASFLRNPNPVRPEWGVPGLLPLGVPTLWGTDAGLLKSTEGRRYAAKTAWWMPGMTWMNTPINQPKNNRVLVICGEDPASIAESTFFDIDALRMMEEWGAAHPDRNPEDNLKVVYQDEIGCLFESQKNKVVRTPYGDDINTLIQEWEPDLIIYDTLSSLFDIEFEMSVNQATALIAAIGAMTPAHSVCILPHHFIKAGETKSLKEALVQTRGSGGFQSRVRHILNAYEPYAPLDDLIRSEGFGDCDEDSTIVCFGVSKTNMPGGKSKIPRVFVRQPVVDGIMQEMVEVTDDVLEHPNGMKALLGKIAAPRASSRAKPDEATDKPSATRRGRKPRS